METHRSRSEIGARAVQFGINEPFIRKLSIVNGAKGILNALGSPAQDLAGKPLEKTQQCPARASDFRCERFNYWETHRSRSQMGARAVHSKINEPFIRELIVANGAKGILNALGSPAQELAGEPLRSSNAPLVRLIFAVSGSFIGKRTVHGAKWGRERFIPG